MTIDQQPTPVNEPGMTVPVAPVAPAPPTARPKTRSSRLLDAALVLAGVIAIGGVAFGVGRATAPTNSAANASGAGFFRNGGGNGFRPDGSFDPNAPGRGGAFALGGGLSIDGTVTAVTADSVTLKLANGQDVTFGLDTSTTYHDATTASSSDVSVGSNVSVKVRGAGGRVFNGPAASAAPGASTAPNGGTGNPRLQASDITVTH